MIALKLANEAKYRTCVVAHKGKWYVDGNLEIGIMKTLNQPLKSAIYKVFFANLQSAPITIIKFALACAETKGTPFFSSHLLALKIDVENIPKVVDVGEQKAGSIRILQKAWFSQFALCELEYK